ncbi:hypothetical protein [Arthrobacter sp. B2a2-09]|uniref:hypothetical protein n=1 Tax=Arthrobacter sp. B2a2-09 TaxID=2952822 RepID=UPI0022CD489E|nr:hypothetical protein [Arthrobacter sp. B2a2-09]MCZ9882298.1 hypothetical protein [Arthrobacter sp. B2a2-09]
MDRSSSYPYDDWSALVGGIIEIRKDSKSIAQGYVDAVMPDSSMLWISGDFIRSRSSYSKADGYEAWISPTHLQLVNGRTSSTRTESVPKRWS